MSAKYRFQNGKGKYILRKYVERFIDKYISKIPKKGMGSYLWATKKIRKNINFEQEIQKTNFFEKFPFKKNIKEILLNKKTHPANLWAAYCFIKMYDNLERINNFKKTL